MDVMANDEPPAEIGCRATRRELPRLAAESDAGHPGAFAHLRRCAACRREFSAFTSASRALRSLAAEPAPSVEFLADLEARTLAAVACEPAPLAPRRRLLSGRRLAVAAACLACAGLGHWLARRSDTPGAGLLRRPPLMLSTVRISPSQGGNLLPVGFTPSCQGLRGQLQVCREAGTELLPSAPSIR